MAQTFWGGAAVGLVAVGRWRPCELGAAHVVHTFLCSVSAAMMPWQAGSSSARATTRCSLPRARSCSGLFGSATGPSCASCSAAGMSRPLSIWRLKNEVFSCCRSVL